MKKIVLPGDLILDRPLSLSNAYTEGGKTYATTMGMLDETGKYTALKFVYKPKVGDLVIGLVIDVRHFGSIVDLNLPYRGAIPSRETRLRLESGDIIVGKIKTIAISGDIDITDVKKLSRGKILDVPPAKVPRIIGKKNSMLSMIEESTNSKVVVGHNGYLWVSESGDIPLLTRVINEIVSNAHKSGLTDRMSKFIKENKR